MSVFAKPANFLKEVKAELGKVSWSTRQEVLGSTFVVIVITAIMALFIFLTDFILSRTLNFIFR
ncbi:MAG: preprotein translocase subunit SecE [Candidatus Omnitrophica bacterium]|nr:preprotein translocase subunit SecE [Candidatus Omnitrophota bacterium]